jgi:hypothetical protein
LRLTIILSPPTLGISPSGNIGCGRSCSLHSYRSTPCHTSALAPNPVLAPILVEASCIKTLCRLVALCVAQCQLACLPRRVAHCHPGISSLFSPFQNDCIYFNVSSTHSTCESFQHDGKCGYDAALKVRMETANHYSALPIRLINFKSPSYVFARTA